MAYDFLGKAIEAGRIAPAPARPAPMMFDFQPKQATQDNFMTRDEVRQALANVSDKQEGLKRLVSGGFILEGYNDTPKVAQTQPAPQEQGFGAGFLEKTGESFKSGISRIGEAGVGLAEGKYTFPEAAARGAAGSLQSFFSPVAGAIGQTFEQFTPESVKTGVAGAVAPIVQRGQEFYAGQSPEQQRALANIGVGGEVLLNFLGGGAATKVAKTGIVQKGVAQGIEGVKEIAPQIIPKAKEAVSGIFTKSPDVVDEGIIKGLGAETKKGIIDNVVVDIPVPKKSIISKAVGAVSRADDPVVLAGRALTPSYAGKTPKQIVNTTKNTEKNVKSFYDLVRTGKLEGDLTDLSTSAESVVNALDTVGAKIGKAVKGAEGSIGLAKDIKDEIGATLLNKIEKRAGAYSVLKNFAKDIKSSLSIQDAFKLKKIYQSEIGKLIKSGDAGTDSYAALVKGVEYVNNSIDNIVSKLSGPEFTEYKKQYALLKSIAADIAKSAQVEGRRSPMTFTEQIGTIQNVVNAVKNPLDTAASLYAKEVGEMNTRGGAWKRLIELYDEKAIKALKKDPFKDLKFLNKVSKGEVKGLSKEALDAMQGVKTVKEAMQKAKSAGVEDEIVAIYPKVNVKTQVSKPSIKEIVSENTPSKIIPVKKDLIVEKKNVTIEPIAPKTKNMPVSNKKIIGLTENGGIKNIEPLKQVKYNQGDYYEPVRMALTQKDADIARVGALFKKQMKSRLTEGEKSEMNFIQKKYGMNIGEINKRAQELRDIAKNARSKTESVLVDLRVEDEIRRVYPLEGSRFDLSKNKKGFVQVGKVDEFIDFSKQNGLETLVKEAKKYNSADEFFKAITSEPSIGLRLIGNDLKDMSIIGSTARGKSVPNDIDILITPKKSFGVLTSDKLKDRIELQDTFKKGIEKYFPGKKVHVTFSEYNAKRGNKIDLKDLYNQATKTNPLEGSRFDLSKNKKGFVQVGKVDEAEAKLMEEARKYKSAEEFIESQGISLFRGGNISEDISQGNLGGGAYFSRSKEMANDFAKGGNIIEGILEKNKKFAHQSERGIGDTLISVPQIKKLNEELKLNLSKDEIKKMPLWDFYANIITPSVEGINQSQLGKIMKKVTGFDGIEGKYYNNHQWLFWEPKEIKTKQQLEEIWNQATKK